MNFDPGHVGTSYAVCLREVSTLNWVQLEKDMKFWPSEDHLEQKVSTSLCFLAVTALREFTVHKVLQLLISQMITLD